jgi:hypothetical protein
VFFGLLAYGLKCAIIKKDPILFLTVSFYAFIWQMAWIFGYPSGIIQSERILESGTPPKSMKLKIIKGGTTDRPVKVEK